MKLLIPDSITLDLSLPSGVTTSEYAVDKPLSDDQTGAEAIVVWGNTAEQLRDTAARLTAVRWVQTLAAGPDAVLAAGFGPDVVITSGAGLHDLTVAEHTLGLTLAAARRLNLLVRAQVGHRWAGELGGNQPVHDPTAFRTLRDARVVIWGFGGIAATLAPYLTALGATVTGVARSAGKRHGFEVVTQDEFPSLLPETDVLISILPATASTRHAVNASVLALLPARAWLISVGRGSVVDESALLAALRAGRLGGAAMDVFETEPLPVSSPLWDEPNVIITPHAAGGRPVGAAELVLSNLSAFLSSGALKNVVER
ncbi:phosphoglycerate dehydrogenase [Actinoplanes sp. NPDC048988]|uniref:phosphoglycerate dehydrogenase n=1 Tax=Actinoplanes sp. NPDC048988 TaxID=3363901 RepID=UPI0037151043